MRYQGNPQLAFADRSKIRRIQGKLLKRQLQLVQEHSPFYQRHFAAIDTTRIELDNLTDLPCTSKLDFERENAGFLAVPKEQIIDMVQSSGTSGHPTGMIYTENDLQRLAYNEAQALGACEISNSDIVLLSCTMDRCFIAGMAYFLGLRALGAGIIRSGASPLETQLGMLERMKPNVILGVPSFIRKLGFHLRNRGRNPEDFGIGKLVCIGEPIRFQDMNMTPMGQQIQEIWGARAFSTYASTETISTFCECRVRQGGHLLPELLIPEILDENDRVLPPGEVGELTVTPLSIEGMPLIRFQTGDITFIIDEPCSCGRQSLRIGPIIGRKHQMIKYQGTTFYPPAVNAVLDGLETVREYQMVVDTEDLSDRVAVMVSLTHEDAMEDVANQLQSAVRGRVILQRLDHEELMGRVFPPGSRKPVRFVDCREGILN